MFHMWYSLPMLPLVPVMAIFIIGIPSVRFPFYYSKDLRKSLSIQNLVQDCAQDAAGVAAKYGRIAVLSAPSAAYK